MRGEGVATIVSKAATASAIAAAAANGTDNRTIESNVDEGSKSECESECEGKSRIRLLEDTATRPSVSTNTGDIRGQQVGGDTRVMGPLTNYEANRTIPPHSVMANRCIVADSRNT